MVLKVMIQTVNKKGILQLAYNKRREGFLIRLSGKAIQREAQVWAVKSFTGQVTTLGYFPRREQKTNQDL